MTPYWPNLAISSFIICMSIFSTTAFANPSRPGFNYQKFVANKADNAQVIHVLKIDPRHYILKAVHADNQVLGYASVEDLAKTNQAVAGINGGFFKTGDYMNGLAAGILKINNDWYGIAYKNRGAVGLQEKSNTLLMDRLQTKTSLKIGSRAFTVHTVNHPVQPEKAAIYTHALNTKEAYLPGEVDIVIQNNHVVAINPPHPISIPKDGFIYTVGPNASKTVVKALSKIKIKDPVNLKIELQPYYQPSNEYLWEKARYIVGAGPLLVNNKRVVRDYSGERMLSNFIQERYARSAIGQLSNGHWVLAMVEDNPTNGSNGMTIPELAEFMHTLGCDYALNLDGGSSSALFVDDQVFYGKANTHPVSDAIIVVPR